MSSNHNYIITLCHKIAESGKTPSLALVRNRSDRPLAIPEVINALKSWKGNPEQQVDIQLSAAPATASLSLEDRVEQLEKQVRLLEEKLNALNP